MTPALNVLPDTPSDWIRKIKANDEPTLKIIYAKNIRAVENYVLKNNGSEDDAKDVYQEAIIATWRNIREDKFQPEDDNSLSAYIFQIAKNKWLDQLRSQKRRKTQGLYSTDMAAPTAQESDPEQDYIDKVKIHFEALGDQCRELLKKFYFEKESLRDIAASFSWTEASAKNNKYRCLQRLRSLVKQKK